MNFLDIQRIREKLNSYTYAKHSLSNYSFNIFLGIILIGGMLFKIIYLKELPQF